MRTAFVESLCDLARSDERVFLLTADLGWSVLEPFARSFPERFLNVGVAEANMLGIATGLAQAGYVPFAYSIATFASMRGYEQMRTGPVLHGLPVRVVGIGGGFAYGHAGPTHYALEDLSLARTQPGLTVLVPADPAQTRSIVRATGRLPGPAYLRIGKGGNAEIPGLEGRFALGTPEIVREGRDVLLIGCGSITTEALEAGRRLDPKGISAAVAVMAHLPFAPSSELAKILAAFSHVVTVEEGFAAGGLGSLVAETIARAGLPCRLEMAAVAEPLSGTCGSEAYMRARSGLDAGAIERTVRSLLARAV